MSNRAKGIFEIEKIGTKWAHGWYGKKNGVFWFPAKIARAAFPQHVYLRPGLKFTVLSDDTIGKEIKSK